MFKLNVSEIEDTIEDKIQGKIGNPDKRKPAAVQLGLWLDRRIIRVDMPSVVGRITPCF